MNRLVIVVTIVILLVGSILLGSSDTDISVADTGEEFTEHAIISGGYLYIPACDYTNKNGGVKKYSMDGTLIDTYASRTYTQCAPILVSSGEDGDCLFLYDLLNRRLNRVRLSDNTITHYAITGDSGHSADMESLGWDTTNNRVIAVVYVTGDSKWYLRAYNMADLSVEWSHEITFTSGNAAVPLIVCSYVYWYNCYNGVLYKLNLSNGTLADSIDLGDGGMTYVSPIYDPDNDYIYSISRTNKFHAIDPSDMSEVWNHTLETGTGSDTDYVTYTGMTTPYMKNGITYHNGRVFVYARENNADADQYHAKIYALNATTGTKAWTNTDLYTDGQDPNTNLLTDDHVVLGTIDYDYSSTNYHVGYFYVLEQSDGTLVYKSALPWGVMCGGATQTYDGRVIFAMENGLWCAVKLGWGTTDDSLHWLGNAYHNGYRSTLTIDTSLTFSTRSTTITGWTEDGGTSIDSEGFGMRLVEHLNHYGHAEKATSALTNFCLEGRICFAGTVSDLGYSWAPRISTYWDTNDWIGIGLAEQPANKQFVLSLSQPEERLYL